MPLILLQRVSTQEAVEMFKYNVGDRDSLGGFFTTFNSLAIPIIGGDNAKLESWLGFHPGRLADGFTVMFLQEMPAVGDVVLAGTTLNSGGRVGPPASTEAEDRMRPFVSAERRAARHAEFDRYRISPQVIAKGKAWSDFDALSNAVDLIQLRGTDRATKIVPAIDHDTKMPPNEQYPVGGGVTQLVLTQPVIWKAAVNIAGNGDWELPAGWPPVDREFLQKDPSLIKRRVRVALENMA